jgi:hypothetical protein
MWRHSIAIMFNENLTKEADIADVADIVPFYTSSLLSHMYFYSKMLERNGP